MLVPVISKLRKCFKRRLPKNLVISSGVKNAFVLSQALGVSHERTSGRCCLEWTWFSSKEVINLSQCFFYGWVNTMVRCCVCWSVICRKVGRIEQVNGFAVFDPGGFIMEGNVCRVFMEVNGMVRRPGTDGEIAEETVNTVIDIKGKKRCKQCTLIIGRDETTPKIAPPLAHGEEGGTKTRYVKYMLKLD